VRRLRFDQDDVRFEARRVRCGLPTNHPGIVGCDTPPMNGEIPVSSNLRLGYHMDEKTRYTSKWPESSEVRAVD
jgi:hypothetical protein